MPKTSKNSLRVSFKILLCPLKMDQNVSYYTTIVLIHFCFFGQKLTQKDFSKF